MILYLLKANLCLLVLLAIYKVLLEREKMFRFNRFYLLASLLFAGVVPAVSIELRPELIPFENPGTALLPPDYRLTTLAPSAPVPTPSGNLPVMLAGLVYGIVTVLFFVRFGWNIYALIRQIRGCAKHPLAEATLVLLPADVIPHTFLHYLFVSRSAYESRAIEPELVEHELTHIRQRHSFDILLIELLGCLLWFNPAIYWFKQAIRLNHEFLADEAVISKHTDVVQYQHLILSKTTAVAPAPFTSTLTFQTTKQRFLMMTKQTSPLARLMAAGSATLLALVLFTTFALPTLAQTPAVSEPVKSPPVQTKPATSGRIESGDLSRYASEPVLLPGRPNSPGPHRKKYSELTEEQKKRVVLIKPMPRNVPTEAQFEAWKNAKKYGIWVNDKRTRNFASTTLKAADIVSYWTSYIHKNARQPEGYLYQVDLMTKPYYEAYLKDEENHPLLVLTVDKPSAK